MLTESQRRAFRARQLLDSGKDPRETAREMGYTSVSGMLGAISLCEARMKRREEADPPKKETCEIKISQDAPVMALKADKPKMSPVARLYPMENGVITVPKGDVSVSWKPKVNTVFINVNNYRQAKWLPLYGEIFGGKRGLVKALRQIAEAATEAAALIEEEEYVDHHAR